MVDALHAYHSAPYPLKVLAASARGWRLEHWRYGGETEELVAQYLERETWASSRTEACQQEEIARTLHHAATRVPYYREQWSARRKAGDRSPWDELANWPVLDKRTVRSRPEAFIADGFPRRSLFVDHTSGTTGTPLPIWLDRAAVRNWYALFEARVRRWNLVRHGDPWAIIGGQLVAAPDRRRPPYWVWNQASRQLYLSAFHITADSAVAYADAMAKHRVTYILGYPSALHALAQVLRHRAGRRPSLKVVLTNAEPLFEHQRETIEEVFSAPVRATYGLAEAVAGASECSFLSLHRWPEVGAVEVLDDNDEPVQRGATGRLVDTGVLNRAMPLIRYDSGDSGALGEADCGCGRALPVFASVEGRSDDLVVTAAGKLVGRLDGIFKGDLPIIEAQIIQHDLAKFEVRFVLAPGAREDDIGSQLARDLRARVGDVTVATTAVDAIPRTGNGKFRAVISKVGQERRPPAV